MAQNKLFVFFLPDFAPTHLSTRKATSHYDRSPVIDKMQDIPDGYLCYSKGEGLPRTLQVTSKVIQPWLVFLSYNLGYFSTYLSIKQLDTNSHRSTVPLENNISLFFFFFFGEANYAVLQ